MEKASKMSLSGKKSFALQHRLIYLVSNCFNFFQVGSARSVPLSEPGTPTTGSREIPETDGRGLSDRQGNV